MAEAAPRLDWPAVSAAVLQALRENVERLNAADRWNHNHGDHMLELGQQLDAAVQAAPESAPPELLARMDEVLAGLQPNGGLQAYRELLARSRAAWLAGEVDESRLIAVARRLVHGEASAADESQRLAGTLGGLLRSLGAPGGRAAWPTASGLGSCWMGVWAWLPARKGRCCRPALLTWYR